MTSEGVLRASLSEPCCAHDVKQLYADKEEQAESQFWDYSCLNAIRVMVYGIRPLEDYK